MEGEGSGGTVREGLKGSERWAKGENRGEEGGKRGGREGGKEREWEEGGRGLGGGRKRDGARGEEEA